MKSRPVLITFSILSALDVLGAGAAFGDVIGVQTLALFVLCTKAVQVGMTFYVQNQVTPVGSVVAQVNSNGVTVAGPASGDTDGTPVKVEALI